MKNRLQSVMTTSILLSIVTFMGAGVRAAAPGVNGRLAFQDGTGTTAQIAVVNDDGSGRRTLNSGPGATAPAWKPASSSIAFSIGGALSSVDLVTDGVTPLLAATGYRLGAPAWSADASRIAFIGTNVADGSVDLWVVGADGTGLTNITADAAVDAEPAWSSDGTKILFATDRDGNFEIYAINPDGTGATRLTDDPAADRDPDMSPDGSTIVFVKTVTGEAPTLWTMAADGTGAAALTDGTFPTVTPAWSPDGASIAFAGAPEAQFDLWTIAPDGSGLTLVAGGSGEQTAPTWQTIVAGDNVPPIADAGGDATLECASPAGATASLDGLASSDPDSTTTVSDIVLYEWFENFGETDETFRGTGSELAVTLSLGTHEITLQTTDSVGQTATASVVIVVEDTVPPVITVSVTPTTIWPPNHRLVTVRATVHGTDVCTLNPVIKLVSVTSNEPDNGTGDGDTKNDVQDAAIGTADTVFQVRAERAGNGTGRIYTATYSATDASNNVASASAAITVPHDQGNGKGKGGGKKHR